MDWDQTGCGAGVTQCPLGTWRKKPVEQTCEKMVLEIWGCWLGTAWTFHMFAHLWSLPAPIFFHWPIWLSASWRLMSCRGLCEHVKVTAPQMCDQEGHSEDCWGMEPLQQSAGLYPYIVIPFTSSIQGLVTCVKSTANSSPWGFATNSLGGETLCPLVWGMHAYTGNGSFSWPVRACSDLAWAMASVHCIIRERWTTCRSNNYDQVMLHN